MLKNNTKMLNKSAGGLFLALFLVFIGNFTFSQTRERGKSMQKASSQTMKAGAFYRCKYN